MNVRCPSCGAAVPHQATVCSYCGTAIPATLHVPAADSAAVRGRAGLVLGLGIAVTAVVVVSTFLLGPSSPLTASGQSSTTPLLTFGEKGRNPGQFDEYAVVALGPDGHIFVAGENDGRLQEFDAEGKHLRTMEIPLSGRPGSESTDDIEVDSAGRVLIERAGGILVYVDGTLERELLPPESLEDVDVDASDRIYARGDWDEVFRLDAQGNVDRHWHQMVKKAFPRETVTIGSFAVTGAGRMVLATVHSDTIYVFGPDGTYEDRFGGEGVLDSIYDIDVDDHDRVFVVDVKRVRVFTAQGQELESVYEASSTNDRIKRIDVGPQGRIVGFTNDQRVMVLDPKLP